MLGCNPCQTPMVTRLKLSKQTETPLVDATKYRSLVGSLRYLVHTRPDLAFAVGYVSRFMEEPHEEHIGAVKQILRYVAGTMNKGLFYSKKKGEKPLLTGYSDSDHAVKQKVVANSSCEAEYIAAATAACQAVWLARVLADILGTGIWKPLLRIDNKSAIFLIKKSYAERQEQTY